MRINDEEEQPNDYADDVVVAGVESKCKNCLRLRQSAPHTRELRYEKSQGGPKKMMNPNGRTQEHLLVVRAPTVLTRETHNRHRGLRCFFAPSLPARES